MAQWRQRRFIALAIVVAGTFVLACTAAPPSSQPTTPPVTQSPAATGSTTATPSPAQTSTPTPLDTTGPGPTFTLLDKLHMSNRLGGEVALTGPNGCTATVPITWYPRFDTEVVTGTATIEIDGPGDIAGLTTVESDSNEVHLVVEFPLAKIPRSWKVTLLQVGDRLVAPAPLDADPAGSQYAFTGPGGNCTPPA